MRVICLVDRQDRPVFTAISVQYPQPKPAGLIVALVVAQCSNCKLFENWFSVQATKICAAFSP